MKFKHLLILIFFIQIWSYAQNVPGIDINYSPGGKLETIFDRFGNQYSFDDIATTPKKDKRDTRLLQSVLLCEPGIFNLYFEDGSGMEATSAIELQRREVVCQVFQDLSNFINTPLHNLGNTTKVNIWIRRIDQFQNFNPNVLGLATGFYNVPTVPAPNTNGCIVDNEIWKTIHTGANSYAQNYAPIAISAGSAGFYHGQMALNFNNINWNLSLTTNASSFQIDLYSVVLHEITHALGFASLLDPDGTSNTSAGNYYSRYDTFLRNNNNQNLISNNANCSMMYNNTFVALQTDLHPTCANANGEITPNTPIADATTCTTAIRFVGANGTIPVYTPNCFEKGSSMSHFEDMCFTNPATSNFYGNNAYFVMSNANGQGVTKRHLTPQERDALCDVGYSLNKEYASGQTYTFDYNGTACAGNRVAGVNDGLANNTFSFTGNAGVPISITGILNNDVSYSADFLTNNLNDLRFECLQDVHDATATITITGDTSSATITFQSAVPAVHLLRYVPYSFSTGLRGNVTYVYVYVQPTNNCGPPVACDLVINGGFEEHSAIPFFLSQINFACNWEDGNSGSCDYFRTDASSITSTIPNNTFGIQGVNNGNGNAYAGFWGFNNREILSTRLTTPLLSNTTYRLQFDVSLGENYANLPAFNNAPIRLQAYLSDIAPNIALLTGSEIPIGINGILVSNNSPTSNQTGWDRITLTITTGSIAGQEFLSIGKITNLENFTLPNSLAYYYIDNVSLLPLGNTSFNLPISICNASTITNLINNTIDGNPTGVFAGVGVNLNANGSYSFNAATAGLGSHVITFSYTNANGCPVVLTDTIIVDTNCAEPFITQTYLDGETDVFIEIKNNSTDNRLVESRYFLALYQDGAPTNQAPTSFVPISSLHANEIWLFRHVDAQNPFYAVEYPLQTLLPDEFVFDGDNDLLIITTATDANAWNARIDLAGNATNWGSKTSWVRSSCASLAPRTDAFDTDDWVAFTIDEMNETYYGDSKTNPVLGRHNSDPLVFTPAGTWADFSLDNNLFPERSREVQMQNNYSTAHNGSFECCSLQLDYFTTLTISPDTYVSVQISVNVLDGATLNVQNNGVLVMVKDSYNGVSGNDLVNLGTNSTVIINKQTVTINSIYDYVCWSSPLTLNPANLPANSVANLFPAPLYNSNRFFGYRNDLFYDQFSTIIPGNYPVQTTGFADGYDDNSNTYYILGGVERNSLMTPGRGYATWPPAGAVGGGYAVNFNGQTNNGIVRVPVYRNDSLLGTNDNFVGNPYPSSIDLNRLFEVNQNIIDPYAAIWGKQALPVSGNPGPEALNYSENGFLIYSPTMPLSVSDQDNLPFNADGILSSCQSFFVHTTTNPSILPENNTGTIQYAGDLIFNNSMRSLSTQHTFAKGVRADQGDKVWLQLQDANKKFTAPLGIAFLDNATDAYSAKEDVKAVYGRKLGLYTKTTYEDLVIDAQPTFDIQKTIPLGVTTHLSENKSYTISLAKTAGIFLNQPIYLADLEMGIVHDLSKSNYSFQSNIQITDNRFVLQFTDEKPLKKKPAPENELVVCLDNDTLEVRSSFQKIQTVVVTDIYNPSIGGLPVAQANNINSLQATLCLDKPCPLIVVKVVLEDGSSIIKKIAK